MAPPVTGAGGATSGQSWGEGITLQDILSVVRRIWRPALLGGLLALPIGIAIGVIRPKSYVAQAAFIAEQSKLSSLPSGLGALAAQFGLDIPGEAGRSPQFYSGLLGTSDLLRALLDSVVPATTGSSQTIREWLIGTRDTSRLDTDRALRKLRKRVFAGADARTSVVTLGVRAPSPEMAERIASMLIEEVKYFNVSTRQLQAKERRLFLDGRVAAAYQALRSVEDSLRLFYERNRRFSESPALVFEESRRKRDIELQQELYTTLSKELETARIQEVNDTPTITVVDLPFAPSKPSGPSVLVLAGIAFILGTGASATWSLVRRTALGQMRPAAPAAA